MMMTAQEVSHVGFWLLVVWFGIMFVGMRLALKDCDE